LREIWRYEVLGLKPAIGPVGALGCYWMQQVNTGRFQQQVQSCRLGVVMRLLCAFHSFVVPWNTLSRVCRIPADSKSVTKEKEGRLPEGWKALDPADAKRA
jgi:hypothetical protein